MDMADHSQSRTESIENHDDASKKPEGSNNFVNTIGCEFDFN